MAPIKPLPVGANQGTASHAPPFGVMNSFTSIPHASDAASQLATPRHSSEHGEGTSSVKLEDDKRQYDWLRYLRMKAAAEAKGSTVYYDKIKRLTAAGKLEAHKASRKPRPSRNYRRETELRIQKHTRDGGTFESFKELEHQRWNGRYESRRQKQAAARETAENVRLKKHLESGGAFESFKPAKPFPRRRRKRPNEVTNKGQERSKPNEQPHADPPLPSSEAVSSTKPQNVPSVAANEARTPHQPVIPLNRFLFTFPREDAVVLPLYTPGKFLARTS